MLLTVVVSGIVCVYGGFAPTTNGKGEPAGIADPERDRPNLVHAYVASGTETAQTLTSIGSDVLKVSPVAVHDNFYNLGRALPDGESGDIAIAECI